jgi:hypothetical protein
MSFTLFTVFKHQIEIAEAWPLVVAHKRAVVGATALPGSISAQSCNTRRLF